MARRIGLWLSIVLAVALLGGSVLFSGVPVAWADLATYSGTVSGSDNLPLDCSGAFPASLPSQQQPFTVDATGSYHLLNVTNGFSGGNSVFLLYQTSFNPASPTTNCIAFGSPSPAITTTLSLGTTYILVTTPFNGTGTGQFTNSISGPGNITGASFTNVTFTPTLTGTPTSTPTVTNTPTRTQTPTNTSTNTPTSTSTPTSTPTSTSTSTPTPTITPTGKSDFSLTKSGPAGPAVIGDVITFTITVTNAGQLGTAVAVRDTLPAGTTFLSSTSNAGFACSASGQVVDCLNGAIAPGLRGQISIVVVVTDCSGPKVNTATVNPDSPPDVVPGDNTATASFSVVCVVATLTTGPSPTATACPAGKPACATPTNTFTPAPPTATFTLTPCPVKDALCGTPTLTATTTQTPTITTTPATPTATLTPTPCVPKDVFCGTPTRTITATVPPTATLTPTLLKG